jgi:hypothetical protein
MFDCRSSSTSKVLERKIESQMVPLLDTSSLRMHEKVRLLSIWW